MLFCGSSLLAGVDASAAQKQPVTKTCLQCGAILPSGILACRFCDSKFQAKLAAPEGASVLSRWGADPPEWANELAPASAVEQPQEKEHVPLSNEATQDIPDDTEPVSAWRGELANRVEAYRVRRRKVSPGGAQSRLPFVEPAASAARTAPTRNTTSQPTATPQRQTSAVAVAEPLLEQFHQEQTEPATEDFSFTIAIGRMASRPVADGRMMIDVSLPSVGGESTAESADAALKVQSGLYPVASMGERQLAGIIDAAFLLFACGGFLALFGSLGGHFTLSKLNGAVCMTALAVVYLQYFALFTVFGGTTPGMMFRGLQVMSFSGETPTPRQMLMRSAGYILSAGTCFLGFFWALWDEDQLTWHDRFSRTFLSSAQTYAEIETHTAAHRH